MYFFGRPHGLPWPGVPSCWLQVVEAAYAAVYACLATCTLEVPAEAPCLLLMAFMLPQSSSCTQLCVQLEPATRVALCTSC